MIHVISASQKNTLAILLLPKSDIVNGAKIQVLAFGSACSLEQHATDIDLGIQGE